MPTFKIVANNLDNYDATKPKNIEIYKVNVDDQLPFVKNMEFQNFLHYFKMEKLLKIMLVY